MQPKTKSLNEQQGRAGSNYRSSNSYAGSNASRHYQSQHRISPWLPLALGAVTLVVIGKALADLNHRETTRERWMRSASNSWDRWWPDIRDNAEYAGGQAAYAGNRAYDWLYDHMPSRSTLSNLFSNSSDWLPDVSTSKRRLLSNFDWRNPPRWLRDVDLSTSSKRKRFLKDLRRYGSRKSDDFLSRLGMR